MKTTFQLLDCYRKTLPSESWYAAAKELGITQQQLFKIRNGLNKLPARHATKIAERLGYEPELVLLWAHVDGMSDKEAAPVWQKLAANYERTIHAKSA